MKLSQDVISFFKEQGFVIASTLDSNGAIHASCKGIVDIKENGECYILDLYHGRTHKNLKANPALSITAVDEYNYRGYTLKGKAEIITVDEIKGSILKKWEKKLSERVSKRLVKNIREDRKHLPHPEAGFPRPKYLFLLKIEEVVDLASQR